MSLLFIVFVFLGALFWAKLEIEVEGKDGWAAGLPTWRVEKHVVLDWLFGGRPLTGYHVWAFAFVLFSFHLPFFWLGTWSLRLELRTVGGYTLFWVVEDFFWFILNPHYGWRKFGAEHVWWHKRWVLGLPVDYWVLAPLGLVLLLIP